MQRSKKRKLIRQQALVMSVPLASSLLAVAAPAGAQQPGLLEEIVVTAQKREESLQDVAVSLQALGNTKLEELNVQNFSDYARFLPDRKSTRLNSSHT